MMRHFLTIIFLIAFQTLIAQNERFFGGVGDGFGAFAILDTNSQITHGNVGDGYAKDETIEIQYKLSQGSLGDGHAQSTLLDEEFRMMKGGSGDGYAGDAMIEIQNRLSLGSLGDGYAMSSYIKIFWTGMTDSDWTRPINWSLNRIPIQSDHVIIPEGKPNYPILPNGKLVVGQSNLNPTYSANTLRVMNNAFLTAESTATIEVRSIFNIAGTVKWKNLSNTAWINQPGSELKILSGGKLGFMPN